MRFKLVFHLLIVPILTSSLSYSAQEEGDLAVCRAEYESFKGPINVQDILHNLFVKFSMKNDRGEPLKFKATQIELRGGVVEFIDPRLNGKVISSTENNCARTKKNIFGYEVCQEVAATAIADKLCKQLGLPGASSDLPSGEVERVANTSEPFSYKFDEGKWHVLKLWSALSPRIYHSRLKKLSCRAF